METLLSPLTVAVLAALSVCGLVMALRPRHSSLTLEKRVATYLQSGASQEPDPGRPELQGTFVERLVLPAGRHTLQFLARLAPSQMLETVNERLTIAGRPGNLGAPEFLGLRFLLLGLGLVLGIAYGKVVSQGPIATLAIPVGSAVLGYMLPALWLGSRIGQRKDKIQRSLPDALDMLTICVQAGLAFESALHRVSQQWRGPLSDEFTRAIKEMRLGVPRPQALRRLSQRCNVPEVSSFVAVLVQADSMGTSISQVLMSQAGQIRTLRRQRAEEKANKAPIKMLIPMVLFIFPALFVVILGPAVPGFLQTFSGMGGR